MFYEDEPKSQLRLGDVLKGFVTTDIQITKPISNLDDPENNFKINVVLPLYSVILTPCCSIEKGSITISPLMKVRADFFKNEHFKEKLTIINCKMSPDKMLPKKRWDKLPAETQTERMANGERYALNNLFVYDKHDQLKEYSLTKRIIKYYMIDFKNVIYLKCNIQRKGKQQNIHKDMINAKILQLTPFARKDLRKKLSEYYYRAAEEDLEFIS